MGKSINKNKLFVKKSTSSGGEGGGSVTSVSGTTNRVTSTGGNTPAIDISATFEALLEKVANKDATGGYAGLTLFKINFKNAANTFTSFFTNAATAARTYTFQDRNGTIADDTDLALKAPLASPALTGNPTAPTQSQNDNSTKLASTAYVDRISIFAFSALTVNNGGTTTINGNLQPFVNYLKNASTATTTTVAYGTSGAAFQDGEICTIHYYKTTASNMVWTFPAGTLISQSCNGIVSSQTLTMVSTNVGSFTMTIQYSATSFDGTNNYKVFLAQDSA